MLMNNLNSKTEFFEGKKQNFDYTVHHRMPKVKFSKKRRRVAYRGITNQAPVKPEEFLSIYNELA